MSIVFADHLAPPDPGPSLEQGRLHGFHSAREEQRRVYGTVFGRCRYEPATRALTIRTHKIRASMAPEDLGDAAEARLSGYLPIVTVVHRSGAQVRVLLSRPPEPGDDLLVLDRRARAVPIVSVGPGAELALPTAGVSRRRWLERAPSDATSVDEFPSYADVIEALTRHV